ncbi:MAG: glycogen debranching protein [Bacteroidota bacterium]
MNLKKGYSFFAAIAFVFLVACEDQKEEQKPSPSLYSQTRELTSLSGKGSYRDAPYVTAGNRVYMVGHQNGSFPDLGWHVKGEMGGIWNHPIKLMDGVTGYVMDKKSGHGYCLDQADAFINYTMANQHDQEIEPLDLRVSRIQFVPDDKEGLVIEYLFRNLSVKDTLNLQFDFSGLVDLRPVWLGERTDMIDSTDVVAYDETLSAFAAQDQGNEWHCIFGSSTASINQYAGENACDAPRIGKGVAATLSYDLTVRPDGASKLTFYIAGSYESKPQAAATYKDLKDNYYSYFVDKKAHYDAILERSNLVIPDKKLEEMYTWTKYATEWLVREVPGQGRGISAGIPDYPWWFGADIAYTVQGVLPIGDHQLAMDAINQLYEFSESANGNGRIVHEVSTNGAVFNPGNVNETPSIILASWNIYEWTGDKTFLNRAYEMAKKGIDWLESVDEDQNGYPDGHGMMEIQGMDSEMVDVVVYTQQAYEVAASMAAELGDTENEKLYADKAKVLKDKINSDWWVDGANSFADFRADKTKAMSLLDDAIIRADTLNKPWAVEELNNTKRQLDSSPSESAGHAFYHNWVVNTPMEMGIADTDKAMKALETGRKFTNRFGVYVTGIDRDENFDESFAASKRKQEFNYVGAVMTLPTGVQAVAESRYGETDRALEYLKYLSNSFGYATPGTMYEVSPDYGMLVQAWNIYSVAKPIVGFFFGIQPQAHKQMILLKPRMPSEWNEGELSNVQVGDNAVSVSYSSSAESTKYTVSQTKGEWNIKVNLKYRDGATYLVNGQETAGEIIDGQWVVELSGEQNIIEVNK